MGFYNPLVDLNAYVIRDANSAAIGAASIVAGSRVPQLFSNVFTFLHASYSYIL